MSFLETRKKNKLVAALIFSLSTSYNPAGAFSSWPSSPQTSCGVRIHAQQNKFKKLKPFYATGNLSEDLAEIDNDKTAGKENEKMNTEKEFNFVDLTRAIIRRLANLSLQDYKWRSDYFKKSEADRRVEESLARMIGDDPSYFRPMDASDSKIGPLGKAEKTLVNWLILVIEEEGKRAQQIAALDGELVRPMDLNENEGGPLAALERSAVQFWDTIRTTEKSRGVNQRPKDVQGSPLGQFENFVATKLNSITEAEQLRLEMQRRLPDGSVVRPIDVPGPLGELERQWLEVATAERQRIKEDKVRPKDASYQGPLGEAELRAIAALKVLQQEERARLDSITKAMKESRPMERDSNSVLGLIEAVMVGIFRAPQMIVSVVQRVQELMESSRLEQADQIILENEQLRRKSSSRETKE